MLLVLGEPGFTATPLAVGSTARRALNDTEEFKFGGNPQHGAHELGKVGCGINYRLGEGTQRA